MGLFYAYAKNVNDDWSYRYLITFASRKVADEWWRAVSTSSQANFVTSIRRVTPQFYTHNPAIANIPLTITTANVAQQFLNQVFFTLINDRDGRIQSMVPPQHITDHINGDWFYIRSKGDHAVYWYVSPSGAIVASKTQSTRFRITAADKSLTGNSAILIGSDQVYLTASGGLSVSVSDYGDLQSTGKAEAFRFSDFTDGFRINAYGSELLPGVASNAIVKTSENDAEEWELTEGGLISNHDL